MMRVLKYDWKRNSTMLLAVTLGEAVESMRVVDEIMMSRKWTVQK